MFGAASLTSCDKEEDAAPHKWAAGHAGVGRSGATRNADYDRSGTNMNGLVRTTSAWRGRRRRLLGRNWHANGTLELSVDAAGKSLFEGWGEVIATDGRSTFYRPRQRPTACISKAANLLPRDQQPLQRILIAGNPNRNYGGSGETARVEDDPDSRRVLHDFTATRSSLRVQYRSLGKEASLSRSTTDQNIQPILESTNGVLHLLV